MEFLFLWIASIIVSIFLDINISLLVFKDLADAGYKIDLDNIHEFNIENYSDLKKRLYITYLIPFLNILESFDRIMKYNSARMTMIDSLRVTVGIEELTKEEQEEYNKKPTKLNAFIIPIKTIINNKKSDSGICNVKTDDFEISFKFGETINDITIIKATGTATDLSEEEQKDLVIKEFKELVIKGIEKYNSVENLVAKMGNTSKNNDSLDITNLNKKDSISEQKQNLENLRKEIVESIKDTKQEKSKILTKRKDKLD